MSFTVRPRYTPGSPAGVHIDLALRVAREERHAIEGHLEGIYGEKLQEEAKKLGLHRIAYYKETKGGKTIVTDLLTHERYQCPALLAREGKVQVWVEEEGWVDCRAWKQLRKDDYDVEVIRADKEVWEARPFRVRRENLRDPYTVRVIESEEWEQEWGVAL